METTSRAGAAGAPGVSGVEDGAADQGVPGARRTIDDFLLADFPWYGLDEAFTGPRRLMQVGAAADGTIEHGSTAHGEGPSLRVETDQSRERFTVVVTVASRPVRRSPDGTGVLEATSVSSAAWLSGSGLLSYTWPSQMERALRDDWLEQQTAIAWELADDLSGPGWSMLTLPVDRVPTPFHYRESEYGWVLAGSAQGGMPIGAFGRGMSAYGLGFSVVEDITAYDRGAAPAARNR
jgi:hypothetical protein